MTTGSGLGDFAAAMGLVLVFEGLAWALAPRAMKTVMDEMRRLDEDTLRRGGLAAMFVGVAVVWLVRG